MNGYCPICYKNVFTLARCGGKSTAELIKRIGELEKIIDQRNAELSRRWETIVYLREALRGTANAAREFANKALVATGDPV